MPFQIKLLKAGAISGAATTELYKVLAPALGAIVGNVRLVNTGGAATTVNLYFTPNAGSQAQILDRNKSISPSDILTVKPELTLNALDKLELTTVAGAALEFVVSGMERV